MLWLGKFRKVLCVMNCSLRPEIPGTALNGKNVAIDSNDFDALSKFCIENNVDLVVVGPETPLVNGIVDVFKTNPNTQHISIVGPSENGAQLEGSKAFAKEFMKNIKFLQQGILK